MQQNTPQVLEVPRSKTLSLDKRRERQLQKMILELELEMQRLVDLLIDHQSRH